MPVKTGMQTLLLAASERNALGHRTSLLDLPKLGRHSSCPSGPGVQRDTNFHSRRRTHAPHNSAQNRAQNDVFEPRRAQRSRLAGAVHPSSVGHTERPVGRFGRNGTAPQLSARSVRSIDGAAATRSPRDGRVGVGRGWRRSPVRRVSPTVSLRVLCAATRTIWALDLCARSGAIASNSSVADRQIWRGLGWPDRHVGAKGFVLHETHVPAHPVMSATRSRSAAPLAARGRRCRPNAVCRDRSRSTGRPRSRPCRCALPWVGVRGGFDVAGEVAAHRR